MLTPFKSKTTRSVTLSYKKLIQKYSLFILVWMQRKIWEGKQFNGESKKGTKNSLLLQKKKKKEVRMISITFQYFTEKAYFYWHPWKIHL